MYRRSFTHFHHQIKDEELVSLFFLKNCSLNIWFNSLPAHLCQFRNSSYLYKFNIDFLTYFNAFSIQILFLKGAPFSLWLLQNFIIPLKFISLF